MGTRSKARSHPVAKGEVGRGSGDSSPIEIDGMLWKPVAGATVTAEGFAAAQALFTAIHDGARWNPWEAEDRRGELDAAMAAMEQWTRAEPGFRPFTSDEAREHMARWEAEYRQRREAREQERQARIPLYDQNRYESRLALLEERSVLAAKLTDVDQLRSKTAFPAMDDRRRAAAVLELEAAISVLEPRVAELEGIVGDPETVVDARGRLPADRREDHLLTFKFDRERQVRQLREEVGRLEGEVKAAPRDQRSKLRQRLMIPSSKLKTLLAIPPLTAVDMCADCVMPVSWQTWNIRGDSALLGGGPCDAWPRWRARVTRAREMLFAAAARDIPPQTPEPKPKPIAVITSGTPIEKVISELQRLQQEHPGCEVRRGNRNRWEIWPAGGAAHG